MIPELELHGVGVQVVLILEIRLVVLANIMIEKGDGYDQRHVPVPVLIEVIEQLLFFVRRERFLEIPHTVLEHVDVFADGGQHLHSFEEEAQVFSE
jgi:hypothetical protein